MSIKTRTWRLVVLLFILPVVASCSVLAPSPTAIPPTATPVPLPPSYAALDSYLKAWDGGRYGDMYDMLSTASQETITKDKFVQRYSAIAEGSTILSVKTSYTKDESLAKAEGSVKLPFSVTMVTARLGEIRQDNQLPLLFEAGRWRVDWSPSLIFKELTGDNRILFDPLDPKRGSILDRKGRPLATTGTVVSVGVQPGGITDEPALLAAIQQQLQIPPGQAKKAYQGAQPDWFVPLKDLSSAQAAVVKPKLVDIPGVIFRDTSARVYPAGSVAAHVVGYVTHPTADELKQLAPKGYGEDDFVGRMGIEASHEDTLAGDRGGRLSVVTPGRQCGRYSGESREGWPGRSISLDLDLQKLAEDSLGAQAGSAVILDVRDNSVLALASFPRFDPNQFITGFSDADWKKLTDDPLHPFQDRPVASTYPTGSVFKVVTMAAAMDKAGFTKDSPFDCNGKWTGLGNGIVLGDWLPQGHGHLNLFEGLEESCDIVFYELAKKID